MLIKDLIKKLEDLYNSYDEDYKAHIGEPDVVIDVFDFSGENIKYLGLTHDIEFQKSDDGVYTILAGAKPPESSIN